MRQPLPERRQQGQRVEHPAEIGQRRQHKGRDQADVIEGLGKHRVQQPGQREQHRGKEQRQGDKQPGVNLERHKEQRHRGHQDAHAQPARHPAAHIAGDNHVRRHRCHQQLLNVALKLGAEERRGDVGVSVGDHRHHDQARHDKLHIGKAMHLADARADQVAENHEVQGHGDHRRHQRLHPDAHKTVDLFGPDAFQRDPIKLHHADSPFRSCTRVTNSSSRRLALLRILSTCTPWALSCAKTLLIPCSRRTSTSSVEVSTS